MTAPKPAGDFLSLDASVTARAVKLKLAVRQGEIVAILGANGSGKSTLLSLISGLIRPDHGRITLGDRVIVDTAQHVWVPPHRRGIVQLTQDPLLFPHMSAVDNVAFGPRSQGVDKKLAMASAHRLLKAVGCAALSTRKPNQLSGGQAQRVAIARALATDPGMLLLDEPLSALDVGAAPGVRQLLRQMLRDGGRTALIVTHDLIDALALADRVVVLDGGRVVEDGPARTVLAQPRSTFTARIAGLNLVAGVGHSPGLRTDDGTVVHGRLEEGCQLGESAVAVFHPSAVAIHLAEPEGSPRNHFPVHVTDLEPRGDVMRVHATPAMTGTTQLVADVMTASAADLDLVPGKTVYFVVKATEVTIYPSAQQS